MILENLNLVTTTSNGIFELKNFILNKAIHGQLIESDVKDNSTIELLNNSKIQYFSGEKTNLPRNWCIVKLKNLADIIRGVTYNKSDSSNQAQKNYLPIFRANNIDGSLNFEKMVYVKEDLISKSQFVKKNDVLIAMSSGSKNLVGKTAQAEMDFNGAFGAFCGLIRLKIKIHPKYFALVLRSPLYRAYISAASQGIGINNLRRESLENFEFYLPPLDEQVQIIAKVDQLMVLCDELDANQKRINTIQRQLNISSLNTLLSATSSEDLENQLAEIINNFGWLYENLDNVKILRQAILKMAFKGHLTSEWRKNSKKIIGTNNDAGSLLVKIKDLKNNNATNAKKDYAKGERTFGVSLENWAWCTFEDMCTKITDGFHYTPKKLNAGCIYISATNIRDNRIDWDRNLFISQKDHDELFKKAYPQKGEILITNRGAGCATAAIININKEFSFQNAALIGFPQDLINSKYVLFYLMSIKESITSKFVSGGLQPMLSNVALKKIEFPLAPTAEQNEIVLKVDRLMALCDELEKKLVSKSAHLEKLTESLLQV